MYIKSDGAQIIKYPYTISDMKKDHSDVSFPKNITEEMLADYGVSRVFIPEPDEHNQETHRVTLNDAPIYENNRWVLGWTVVAKTTEEIDEELEFKKSNIRHARDELLSKSDWTQLPDAQLTETQKTAWTKYRQELRDVPEQEGFPNSFEWPSVGN